MYPERNVVGAYEVVFCKISPTFDRADLHQTASAIEYKLWTGE